MADAEPEPEPQSEPETKGEAPKAADEAAPATPQPSAVPAEPQKADPAPQANGLSSNSAAQPRDDRTAEIDQVPTTSTEVCI